MGGLLNPGSIFCIALHAVVLVRQWKDQVGWAQCVKSMAKGLESHGHEGKRQSRHCTSMGRGAAQSGASALHKCYVITRKWTALLRLGVARATARGGTQGNARSVRTATSMQRLLPELPHPANVRRWWFPAPWLHGMRTANPLQDCLRRLLTWWSEEKGVSWTMQLQCWEAWHNCVFTPPGSMHMPRPKPIIKKRCLRNGVKNSMVCRRRSNAEGFSAISSRSDSQQCLFWKLW